MNVKVKMVLVVIALLSLGLTISCLAENEKPAVTSQPVLATQADKVSYSIGVQIGKGLKQQGATDLNPQIIAQGMADALSAGKLQMTDDEIQTTMIAFQTEMRKKQAEAMQAAAEKNKKDGQAFLEKNKTAEGVITLPSGLQYKVIKAGTGEKPKATDTVKCHYKGTLIDGTEFDSSYKRNEPTAFSVNRVIAGWTEALQLMPVGSKWQLFVPSDLAYGLPGRGAIIGPNSTLIFEIELLSIEKP